MEKKKITLVVNNFWYPAVYLTGIKSVLDLAIKLSKEKKIDVSILTNIDIWDKSLNQTKIRKEDEIKKSIDWINSLKKKNQIDIKTFTVPIIFKLFSVTRFFYLRLYPILFFLFIKKDNNNVIHEFSSSPIMLVRSLFFKKFLNQKVVHTFLTLPNNIYKKKKLSFLGNVINNISIVATNKIQKRKLSQLFPKCNIDYLSVGYSKFNDNHGKFPQINQNNNSTISFLGPLRSIKGYESFVYLAEHFNKNKIKNIKFFLACHPLGTSHEHDANIKKIKNMKLNNLIIFDDWINKKKFYEITDIMIFPQTTLDGATGHPVTLLEALGYDKFCIVNDIFGLKELITKKNGRVCDTSNIEKVCDMVLNILNNNSHKNIQNKNILVKHSMKYISDKYIKKYY